MTPLVTYLPSWFQRLSNPLPSTAEWVPEPVNREPFVSPEVAALTKLEYNLRLPLKWHIVFCSASSIMPQRRKLYNRRFHSLYLPVKSGTWCQFWHHGTFYEPYMSWGNSLKCTEAINQQVNYNDADGSRFDLIGVQWGFYYIYFPF